MKKSVFGILLLTIFTLTRGVKYNVDKILECRISEFDTIKIMSAGYKISVHYVFRLKTMQTYAAKVFHGADDYKKDQSLISQFYSEIRALDLLKNSPFTPNVICTNAKLIEKKIVDEPYFIIMEHIPGFDLGSFANQYDPVDKENFLEHFKINYTFDLDKIREIAAKCVLALEHLKAARLISRDIKPGNIMVDNGKVKLIDFNASVMKKDEDIKRMGTLFFIAPELASTPSRLDYSTSSDIFSLGVTLYHLHGCNLINLKDSEEKTREKMYPYRNVNQIFMQKEKRLFSETMENLIKVGIIRNCPKEFNLVFFDLIRKMICDSKNRLTIEQIKKHRFFQKIDWDKMALNLEFEDKRLRDSGIYLEENAISFNEFLSLSASQSNSLEGDETIEKKATLKDENFEQTSVNVEKSAKEPEGLIANTSNAEKTVEIKEDKVDEKQRKSDERHKYFKMLQQIKVLREEIFAMEALEKNEQALLACMRNRLENLEQINHEAEEKVACENNFGGDEIRKYFEMVKQINREAEMKVLREEILSMETLERNEVLLARMRHRLEILEKINHDAEEKVANENNFGGDIKKTAMNTEEAIVKNSKSEGAVEVNEVHQDQKIISDSNELSQEIIKDEMNDVNETDFDEEIETSDHTNESTLNDEEDLNQIAGAQIIKQLIEINNSNEKSTETKDIKIDDIEIEKVKQREPKETITESTIILKELLACKKESPINLIVNIHNQIHYPGNIQTLSQQGIIKSSFILQILLLIIVLARFNSCQ